MAILELQSLYNVKFMFVRITLSDNRYGDDNVSDKEQQVVLYTLWKAQHTMAPLAAVIGPFTVWAYYIMFDE